MGLGYTDFALVAIILILGGIICIVLGKRLGLGPLVTSALYAWHTILGYFFSNYVLIYGGDPYVYYERAKFETVDLTFGTDFVVWLTSFPAGLGFSYWETAFLYNFIGALGLTVFAGCLREISSTCSEKTTTGSILFAVCVFIPSISFWTSGIGKDSLAFLGVALFCWSSLSLDRRLWATFLSVLLMLAVRPHVAAIMTVSVAVGGIYATNVRLSIRYAMAGLAAIAAAFAVPLALNYSGATQFISISDYVTDRQEKNLGGGSSLDISGMNPAVRLFTFLYRPLPNEAIGLSQLASAIDNTILLILTAIGVYAVGRAGAGRVFRHYGIAFLYGISCLAVLSQVTANLGLASRQKWMAVPALMIMLYGAWHLSRTTNRRGEQPADDRFLRQLR